MLQEISEVCYRSGWGPWSRVVEDGSLTSIDMCVSVDGNGQSSVVVRPKDSENADELGDGGQVGKMDNSQSSNCLCGGGKTVGKGLVEMK